MTGDIADPAASERRYAPFMILQLNIAVLTKGAHHIPHADGFYILIIGFSLQYCAVIHLFAAADLQPFTQR